MTTIESLLKQGWVFIVFRVIKFAAENAVDDNF